MKILIDGQTLSTPELHRGIGEMFLQILNSLIPLGKEHEFFLCVYDDRDHTALPDSHGNINLLSLGKSIDTSDSGSNNYTESVLQFVSNNDIDCFWIPNPVMPNVNFIQKKPKCRVIVTFFDLIPLIFKKVYFNSWSDAIKKEYLRRLNTIDSIADFILPISYSTQEDLRKYLKINPAKMRTVYLGSKKEAGKYKEYRSLDPSPRKYILYVGGFDPRKNIEKSVLAFKHLVEKYHHNDLEYLIVCHYDTFTKTKFYNFVQETGLCGKVHLTGFISKPELNNYYKNAELLFFPSLYEGFGLPVVDAIASGLPVVVSNCSSLPEIAGNAGLICNPEDPADMAEKINLILSNSDLRARLSVQGIQRSKLFTWEKSAEEYLQIIESKPHVPIYQDLSTGSSIQKERLKIAYFSPLYPQVSGISQYSKELLMELQKLASVDLFVDVTIIPDDPKIKQNHRFFCYTEFDRLVKTEKYDGILYHIGNNPLHEYIYRMALRYPGIIVLHDYVIYPFLRNVTLDRGKLYSYLAEINNIEPSQNRMNLIRQVFKSGLNSVNVLEYPLNDRIIKAGKAIIVHSQYVRKLLNGYPHVYVIPHGRHPVYYTEIEILETRKMLNLKENDLIISVFGFLNWNKRIDLVIRVFEKMQMEIPNIKLLLVGSLSKELNDIVKSDSDSIDLIGYTPEDLYYKYLSVSDIVINLRSPTMGETSGTLLDAMGFGKPVIVSNVGSYKEVPDNCCWKVDMDESQEELLSQYLQELITNPELREVMGKNGRKFIETHNDWTMIASEYIKVIKYK